MSPVRTFTSSPLPPRERGVEFGRANADEVRRSVAGYLALFARRGAPGYDARRWAAEFRDLIGDLEPDALAEIDGIAEGARVDALDVVAVNARTELLAKADPYGQRECSSVVVTPADAPAYGVQTWDWYASMADNWLRWRIPQPDGSWLETVTEYGLLAKIGVSSRGVGVLLNMLRHAGDDNDRVGLPVHLLSRRILTRAASYDEAAAMCHDTKVCASTSLTVLDRERGATVELFPDGPGVVEPTDGVLVRTNHFVSEAGRDGCLTPEDVYPELLPPAPPPRAGAARATARLARRRAGRDGAPRPRGWRVPAPPAAARGVAAQRDPGHGRGRARRAVAARDVRRTVWRVRRRSAPSVADGRLLLG